MHTNSLTRVSHFVCTSGWSHIELKTEIKEQKNQKNVDQYDTHVYLRLVAYSTWAGKTKKYCNMIQTQGLARVSPNACTSGWFHVAFQYDIDTCLCGCVYLFVCDYVCMCCLFVAARAPPCVHLRMEECSISIWYRHIHEN